MDRGPCSRRSIYPGDGIVAKNNYQTSSGERYDQSAPRCRGRALDCTPAVDKALHLGGLGSVRVEPYPPLPKTRPAEPQAATWSGTDPMGATVKPPAGYESDRNLRPSPSNDVAQRLDRPK